MEQDNKKNQTTSAIFRHMLKDDYEMDFENTKIISVEEYLKKLIREIFVVEENSQYP